MAQKDNCHTVIDVDAWREECSKCIRELMEETAYYWSLSLCLGTTMDTDILKDQLRHSRKKAYELAKHGRLKQLPRLRDCIGQGMRSEDYERLGALLTSTMELLIIYLCRTLIIFDRFQYTDEVTLLNTGMSENFIRPEPCFVKNIGKTKDEEDQFQTIAAEKASIIRYMESLRSMVVDIYETVDFQPWNVEPEMSISDGIHENSRNKSLARIEYISVRSRKFVRSRRCKFVMVFTVIIIISAVIIIGIILGVTAT